jgi:hypothetical protein
LVGADINGVVGLEGRTLKILPMLRRTSSVNYIGRVAVDITGPW